MREILFRGKRVDNNEWVEGSLYYDPDLEQSQIYGFNYTYNSETGEERECFHHLVDCSTVGQYTGLTDKNGKKIFEGDILKHIKNQKICLVCWHASFSQFVIRKKKYNYNSTYDDLFLVNRYYEVIGNIYDNPELLGD